MEFSTTDFNLFFPNHLVSRCGETNLQVLQGDCFPGCCWPTAREDSSDDDMVGASDGGGVSGRGENVLDGSCA